jgi:type I restriction enzyme S subunit
MDLSAVRSLPTGWTVRAISDVCERVTSGGTPSRRVPGYYVGGIWPWVKTQELEDGWLTDTEEHITDQAIDSSSAKVLPQTTVLLAMYGATVGKLGLLARPMTCNQACCALIVNDDLADYRFVYYLLLHARPQLVNLAVGAAQQNLSGELIKSLRFAFPPRDEQRAIAHALGILDDKVEINYKRSRTLEALARTLFKAWFVDFDPARERAQGKPYGLAQEIAALFPDSFQDSAIGELPRGWKVGTLTDIANLNPESWSRKDMPETIRYVDLSSVKWGHFEESQEYTRYAAPSRAQRILRSGDTIVGTVRPANGSYGLVAEEGLTGSTGFAVLRPKKWAALTYLCATARENIERLSRLAYGAAYPAIRPETVAQIPIVLPTDNVLAAFDAVAAPLLRRCSQMARESRILIALRSALLPKLLSGELTASDAMGAMERSA